MIDRFEDMEISQIDQENMVIHPLMIKDNRKFTKV